MPSLQVVASVIAVMNGIAAAFNPAHKFIVLKSFTGRH